MDNFSACLQVLHTSVHTETSPELENEECSEEAGVQPPKIQTAGTVSCRIYMNDHFL